MMKIHRYLSYCCLDLTLVCLSMFNCVTLAATGHISLDKLLLNCGSSESSSFNGKNWTGDVGSNYLPSDYNRTSTLSIASNPSVPKVPYSTARIFHSRFTYSFPMVTPGHKFIRLYFYSDPHSTPKPSQADFSVVAGEFTLLDNFSPSSTASALKSDYFIKDFSVNIKEQKLHLTFIPSPMASNAFAFVNGIEIFSLPLNLYIPTGNVSLALIGQQEKPFFIHDETALEILYRVNVADEITVSNIFGTWSDDSNYTFGPVRGMSVYTDLRRTRFTYNRSEYFAPEQLYYTARTMGTDDAMNMNYNLTWSFAVDSGFRYFIRLHFCEISSQVTEVNQRVFEVYINNQIAENKMDLIALTGAPYVPMFRDYIAMVPEQDLRLDLRPNTDSKPKYANAILNGIEIMKLSDDSKSLAAHIQTNNEKTDLKARKRIFIAVVVIAILGLFLACFIAFKLSKKRLNLRSPTFHQSHTINDTNADILSLTSSDHCRRFSLVEIKAATNNFDEALVIGSGGFGEVYKGFIDGGTTNVAVKRGKPKSNQGVREFLNEIELLSKFQHTHVVSLKGYCQEGAEMILIYEYMANGTLRDHLYKSQKPPLPWSRRLKICVGAARGLHYLHTGAKYSIIHRDVKTANVLLDDEWVAKISDFGLSRVGPTTASCRNVSTEVKGTFGYLDPEYCRYRKLADKSDVYSFGVVLFEVLCGRPAVKPVEAMEGDEDDERVSLAEWALHCHRTETVDRMIDRRLREKIAPECLAVFVDIAVQCLAETGSERPLMSDILRNLERALQLQEIADVMEEFGSSTVLVKTENLQLTAGGVKFLD